MRAEKWPKDVHATSQVRERKGRTIRPPFSSELQALCLAPHTLRSLVAAATPGAISAVTDAAHGDWIGAAVSAVSAIPPGHLPGVPTLGGSALQIAKEGGKTERDGNTLHGLSDVALSDPHIRARFEELQAYRRSSPHVPNTLTGDRAVDGVTALLATGQGRYFGHNGCIRKEGETRDAVMARDQEAGFNPNGQTPTHAEGHFLTKPCGLAPEEGLRDCLSILRCVLHARRHSRGFYCKYGESDGLFEV